ncbi:MAG: hypothetical protein ACW981_11530 [Candidatus Hodarchaeales archaeon]
MPKIAILGITGSGKSALATRLSVVLDVPVYHLDDIFWLHGWKQISRIKFRKAVKSFVGQDKWIIDGNHSKTMDLTLSNANLVIFLDIPLYIALFRLVTRSIGRNTRFKVGKITPLPVNVQDLRSTRGMIKSISFLWYQAFKFRFKKKNTYFNLINRFQATNRLLHIRRLKEIEFLLLILEKN